MRHQTRPTKLNASTADRYSSSHNSSCSEMTELQDFCNFKKPELSTAGFPRLLRRELFFHGLNAPGLWGLIGSDSSNGARSLVWIPWRVGLRSPNLRSARDTARSVRRTPSRGDPGPAGVVVDLLLDRWLLAGDAAVAVCRVPDSVRVPISIPLLNCRSSNKTILSSGIRLTKYVLSLGRTPSPRKRTRVPSANLCFCDVSMARMIRADLMSTSPPSAAALASASARAFSAATAATASAAISSTVLPRTDPRDPRAPAPVATAFSPPERPAAIAISLTACGCSIVLGGRNIKPAGRFFTPGFPADSAAGAGSCAATL
mmetsp:Transcript_8600/g.21686  ORF Transcript_8600/g.21686 Transcript_8600/m.21686 type:complete len:317 (-) Transcript_8600:755-1705(-)